MAFDLTKTEGGGAAIAPAPVSAIWSGPHGYLPNNDRQVTAQNPGTTWVDASGATAADAGLVTDAQWTSFRAEFPTAVPGLLYGIVIVAWGNSYAYIGDMYNSSDTTTKEYRDRESWAYGSGNFCLNRIFESKTQAGGLWPISFAKPIPFYLGLRVTYDNGSSMIYFLYTLSGKL